MAGDELTVTDALNELLLGEAPSGLPEELRDQLETAVRAALDEQRFGEAAEWVEAEATRKPKDFRVRFLASVVQEVEEDERRAAVGHRDLARALADAGDWQAVRALALRAVRLRPDERSARLIVRAWEHLEPTPERERDFRLARELCPESPELLWDACLRAEGAGDRAEADRLAVRALAGFARNRDDAAAEVALLRSLESEETETLRGVWDAVPLLAQADLPALVGNALEFLEPELLARSLHAPALQALEVLLTELDAYEAWRPLYVQTLIAQLGGEEVVGDLVRSTGLADPDQSFRESLERFRGLSKLSAGAYVEHKSWGVGRITANDGASLLVDFAERKGHRMDVDMAIRSLQPLSDRLLRVRAFADVQALRQQAEDDPPAVLLQALRETGDQATTQELRRALEDLAVPKEAWTRWWAKARKAVAEDFRVDDSEAFRQVYRAGSEEGGQSVGLPPLDASKGLRPAIASIGRLLKQHPQLEEAAIRAYGPELSARLSTASEPEERLSVLPALNRWYPERREEWAATIASALDANVGVSSVSVESDQADLLALALTGDRWLQAALSALPSRFLDVRRRALAALQERMDETVSAAMLDRLMNGRNCPEEAVALVGLALEGEEPLAAFGNAHPWHLFLGVFSALSVPSTPQTRKRALEVLSAGGALSKLLGATPCPESLVLICQIAVARAGLDVAGLRKAKELLTAVGATDLSERVQQRLAPPPEAPADDQLALAGLRLGVTYMTRLSFGMRKDEIQRLEHQLRVELPEAIKRARELGDLSENAEYHAAREAQGIVGSQVAGLKHLLQAVAFIEDIVRPDGRITLGTVAELRYEETGDVQTVWLLGEGDAHYGSEVISYTSQLGHALLAREAGDEVEFEVDGEVTKLTVVSTEPKLP
ncbi:MAG: hypothetical protein COZ06_16185 [Armatimonadetes bacterium CG_4_10_14_3_um_filter_66_18]|nr:hypothetical protein [Armatimonadota bacterium]OIO98148.1 MAG: hypothetical protein AUJ96_21875 [Armatimonadetes bacterium CG2_30_66_41]PIX45213.1 MAG: hypothetical protein COZ57_16050 [Armatimonadetes bacterium CG_4_8_14_3_um_filter_66_20]PIY48573.1 MAG: hypothetical protein COZ06_16185 [Armatimonadetes bacterium CG_4_10_14_3_um_filter_66_18]PIZ47237.1 MAG: hypothetical protein COY42_08990 [Armatimonadetes bacterium CG_4_10_14_0_8_um_filter_66_14]